MRIDLRGKVALVTGGSRGIGAAVSIELASAGAMVAVNFHRNHAAARAFARRLRRKRLPFFLVPGDVSDFLEADSVVHSVIERTRRLDILVNNAGVREENPLDSPHADEAWDRTLRINLKSVFNMCVHASPHLARHGDGRIVNISSTAGQRGEPRYSHYAASKAAIIALTKSLAAELAPRGILVNCVAPGWVWTDMTLPCLRQPRRRKELVRQIPLARLAQPREVAGPVLFLASPLAGYVTGEVLEVNGGLLLCG